LVSQIAAKIGRGFIRHVKHRLENIELDIKSIKENMKIICEVEMVNLLDKDPEKARDLMARTIYTIDKYVHVAREMDDLRRELDAIAETIEKEYQT